jgi:prephenate dehydrogenase
MARALIAGLGLIGGSIGKALVARGWHVAFVDDRVEDREARAAAAAHEKRESIVSGYDLIVLATPVDEALDQARMIPHGALATSVCSVMEALSEAALSNDFIAGHPMAGSHESGLHSADINLFKGKTWFVERHHPLVEQMIRDCGATMRVVDPRKHDEAVAATSHLPQLLSTALASYLNELNPDLEFTGTGLRDFLRLAQSHPSVWLPVFGANRHAIDEHLHQVIRHANRIADGDRMLVFGALDFIDKLRG